MEYVWRRTPFLRIIIPFIIGIYLSDAFTLPIAWCTAIALGLYVFLFYCPLSFPYKWRHLYTLCTIITIIMLGALSNDHSVHKDQPLLYTISSWPKEKPKSYTFFATNRNGEKVRFTLLKTACSKPPELGQGFFIRKKIDQIEKSKHDFGFQADLYYNRQNIHRQCLLGDSLSYFFPEKKTIPWYHQPLLWRDQLIQLLYAQPISEESKGVLAALILGYSDDIDDELMQSYSQAGVVHVLAVSGLHVGLIYVLLNPLFALLGKKRWAKNLRLWIPFLLLWVYAAITGFSPSVMRAAVMFSFFLVAERFEKNPNGLNTLCASAFFLLLFDSSLVFNIGFQLSYLAVLGILVFEKPMRNLFYIKNKWLRKGWELVAVSLAAQLTTTPISLYYFHQFPTYFLAANIILVPLSTIILYAGLAFFALAFYPPIAVWIIRFTALLTEWMNAIGSFIGNLPGSLMHFAAMSSAQLWLMMLMVVAFGFVFLQKSKKALLILLALPLCWPFFNIPEFPPTLLSIRKHEAIIFLDKNELFIAADSSFALDSIVQKYTVKALATEINKTPQYIPLQKGIDWLCTHERPVLEYRPGRITYAGENTLVLLYAWNKKHYFTEEEWSELACHTVWVSNDWSRKKQALIEREITLRGGKVLLEEEGDIQLPCLPSCRYANGVETY